MILTIIVSVFLSVSITFILLYLMGLKQAKSVKKAPKTNDLEKLLKELENINANIEFQEISEDDFMELYGKKDDKKTYH
jgi:hypothetical protein